LNAKYIKFIRDKLDIIDGIVRWKSNGVVPDKESRKNLLLWGIKFDEEASALAYTADWVAFLNEHSVRSNLRGIL
jgi:hypothetical protein